MKTKNRTPGMIIAIIFFFMGFFAHAYYPRSNVTCPENIDLLMEMCVNNNQKTGINNEKNNEFFTNHLLGGNLSGFQFHDSLSGFQVP